MRDPNRIPVVLAAVQAYWEKNPDLRLGQIICNCQPMKDPFFIEEEKLLEWLLRETDREAG